MRNNPLNIDSSATANAARAMRPIVIVTYIVSHIRRISLVKVGLSDQENIKVMIRQKLPKFSNFRPKPVGIPSTNGENIQIRARESKAEGGNEMV